MFSFKCFPDQVNNAANYTIKISFCEKISWEVKRTKNEICDFWSTAISILENETNIATSAPLDNKELEAQLQLIYNKIGSDLWNTTSFLEFIDDSPSSSTVDKIRFDYMDNKINNLSKQFEQQETQIRLIESKYNELIVSLRGWAADPSTEVDDNQVKNLANLGRGVPHQSIDNRIPMSGRNRKDPHGSSFISVNSALTDMTNDDPLLEKPRLGLAKNASTDSVESSHLAGYSSPTNAKNNGIADPSNEKSKLFDNSGSSGTPRTTGDCGSISALPSSPFLAGDLYPGEDRVTCFTDAIGDIVTSLRPHQQTIKYRSSVIALIRRQARIALGCSVFEVGLHNLQAYLPDDSVKLTIVIGKSLVPNWQLHMSDRLNYLSERCAACGGSLYAMQDEEDVPDYQALGEEPVTHLNHFISHVSNSKFNSSYSVHCVVDNTEVEISCNSRSDLCMLAFLEEVNTLLGKDNLFKRSLILIRAWWFYETTAYVGTSIKHYLPDFAFCVMVCAVFNQYHTRISSPLQALTLFLTEYSGFDGTTQAITLQGIVPFKSSTSSQPLICPVISSHLIGKDLIDKYWLVFNISYTCSETPDADYLKLRSTSSEDFCPPSTAENIRAIGELATKGSFISIEGDGLDDVRNTIQSLSAHNLSYFDRLTFSVVHPFTHSNMILEKLSARRQMRLTKAFQIGATELSVYLKQNTAEFSNSRDIIKNYFPTIITKFEENLKNAIKLDDKQDGNDDENKKSDDSVIETIWSNIGYCNLMLESFVTEGALLMLSVEILTSKGSLPVGEIGKILSELTCIPNLSQKLKEKFGGLKKFLEHYPSKFVISNDHPFNPNVLLRSSLSPEHLELIDRGIFPHQLLAKSKKSSTSGKKKKSHSIPISPGDATTKDSINPTQLGPNSNSVGNSNYGNQGPTSQTGVRFTQQQQQGIIPIRNNLSSGNLPGMGGLPSGYRPRISSLPLRSSSKGNNIPNPMSAPFVPQPQMPNRYSQNTPPLPHYHNLRTNQQFNPQYQHLGSQFNHQQPSMSFQQQQALQHQLLFRDNHLDGGMLGPGLREQQLQQQDYFNMRERDSETSTFSDVLGNYSEGRPSLSPRSGSPLPVGFDYTGNLTGTTGSSPDRSNTTSLDLQGSSRPPSGTFFIDDLLSGGQPTNSMLSHLRAGSVEVSTGFQIQRNASPGLVGAVGQGGYPVSMDGSVGQEGVAGSNSYLNAIFASVPGNQGDHSKGFNERN